MTPREDELLHKIAHRAATTEEGIEFRASAMSGINAKQERENAMTPVQRIKASLPFDIVAHGGSVRTFRPRHTTPRQRFGI